MGQGISSTSTAAIVSGEENCGDLVSPVLQFDSPSGSKSERPPRARHLETVAVFFLVRTVAAVNYGGDACGG